MTKDILIRLALKAKAFAGVLRNERGTATIEFAIIVGMVALAAIQAMPSLGSSLADTFDEVEQAAIEEGAQDSPAPSPIIRF